MKTPSIFYRYRSIDPKTLECLCCDQLHFSNPRKFNDPLDCKPTVMADCDVETLRILLGKLVGKRVFEETVAAMKKAKIKNIEAVESHAINQANKEAISALERIQYFASNPDESCNERLLLAREVQEEIYKRNNKGICCFSESYKNPLLWSHYGDQHRGICIGYGLERKPLPEMHRAVYGGCRTIGASLVAEAILGGDKSAMKELDRALLLRKAPEWKYEKEWRLFGTQGLQLSSLALKSITFGLRCSDTFRYVVISCLSERNDVQYFHIASPDDSFKLIRRKLDRSSLLGNFPQIARSGIEIFGEAEDHT